MMFQNPEKKRRLKKTRHIMSDADVMIQNLHHLCLLMRFPRTIETPIFHRKRYQVVFYIYVYIIILYRTLQGFMIQT